MGYLTNFLVDLLYEIIAYVASHKETLGTKFMAFATVENMNWRQAHRSE